MTSITPNKASDDSDATTADWLRRVKINIDSHNLAERLFHRRDTILSVIVLCIIVALGGLAASINLTRGPARWVVIGLTLAGSIISALHAHFDYGAQAAAHRSSARQYAVVRRTIEMSRSAEIGDAERVVLAREARRQWDFAASASPNVPQSVRNMAKARASRPDSDAHQAAVHADAPGRIPGQPGAEGVGP